MSKSLDGECRPASVVGCAVQIATIVTGEIENNKLQYPSKYNSGVAGGYPAPSH